jgi:ABC-type uncharacterized transport system substrate-binding protein
MRRRDFIAVLGSATVAWPLTARAQQPPILASFNRPGGNITGIAALQADLIKKRVEVLREFVPEASLVAMLVNPKNPYTEPEMRAVHDAASSFSLRLHVLRASNAAEIGAAFGALAEVGAGALLVSADLYLLTERQQFVALSARYTLPVIYPWREYVDAGGLMSYGPNNLDANRLIGVYIGKILNRQTCRSSKSRRWSSSLISRPQRCSGVHFQLLCSSAPMRSSSKSG